MGRKFLILLFVSGFSALRCFSQITSNDDILRRIVSQNGQAEVFVPRSNIGDMKILTLNTSILSVKGKIVYISLSPLTIEWFLTQKYDYTIVEKPVNKGIVSSQNVTQAFLWDSYPTYLQYDSIMRSFVTNYPSLCRLDTIGKSINGKLVLALKISRNVATEEDEPKVFYTSSMHGDETGGYILMLRLADYLLKNYNVSGRVKNLMDNLEVWINPLANPDGTYGTGNTLSSPVRYNANGYDLNRNFPDPFTLNTIKQKETLDMIRFMRKHKFSLSVNFHSGEEVVNYPWDRWISKFHADDSWFNSISRAYADTAHIYAGPAYMNFMDNGVTRGAVWYIVYGGRQDFVTWELHGREVTIEVDNQFVTPAAQLPLLWQNNWHSLLGYMENALYGIHGYVRNANTHAPVPAKVFISGHDFDSSQVYSDTLTGSFVRYLAPGSWNISFTAKGYQPLVINNVVVAARQRTDMTAEMLPLVNGVENFKSNVPVQLYPNPSGNTVSALLPDGVTGIINIRIIDQTGRLMSDFDTRSDEGNPLLIDIKSLSSGVYTIFFKEKDTGKYCHGKIVVIN
jgi:hypothetical protein